jgi:hypothetical protein
VQQDTPGAKLEEAEAKPAQPEPLQKIAPTVERARALLDRSENDAAMRTLWAVRRRSPKNAAVALLLGHVYFRKAWRTDGLREYGNALLLRASYKQDTLLRRNCVSALEDPTYGSAKALIEKSIGRSALPELRTASKSAKSWMVRARANMLVSQLSSGTKRRR